MVIIKDFKNIIKCNKEPIKEINNKKCLRINLNKIGWLKMKKIMMMLNILGRKTKKTLIAVINYGLK
jgi:hypothetical protein